MRERWLGGALGGIAAAVLVLASTAATGAAGDPISVRGDAAALAGDVREDVTEVVVTRLDGTEQELELDRDGDFSYTARRPGEAARLLRAYDRDGRLLSTVAPRPAAPRCGGAAGPCADPETAPASSSRRAASAREPSPQDDPFSRISNEGTPVELSAEGRRALERMGMPNARAFLLATSGGRAFYRLAPGPRGRPCFATGPAITVGRFGILACVASGFPSRARPILDFSSFELKRGEREPRVLRLEGIAADAIAAVALVGPDGKVVARVPVERNVFALASPPPPPLRLLLALGAGDEVVYRQPFAGPVPPREAERRGVAGYGVRLTFPRGWDAELYRPRGAVTAGPIVLAANFPLRPFRRVEDVAAAARRMPRDGILIFLGEAGAGSRQRFPRAALPLELSRAHLAAAGALAPARGVATRDFSVNGRLFQLLVHFGRRPVSASSLRQLNAVLRTLRVAPRVPTPDARPLQQGEADGASVRVYRSGIVVFRFDATATRLYRLLAGTNVSAGCIKFRTVRGPWDPREFLVWKPFARELAATFGRRYHSPAPPYDACTVRGSWGRRWNDPRGMRNAVEVPFNERARRFFDEQAVARDLALFVRSPTIRALRRSDAPLPDAAAIARRFRARVTALPRRGERAQPGRIGVWTDGRDELEVSERTPGGRRLFILVLDGRIARHNLQGLAFVF